MTGYLSLAAANSTLEARRAADYVCDGEHDQRVIQQAIDRCIAENQNLFFFNGRYVIDAFYDPADGGPKTALCIPNAHREVRLLGQNHQYGFQKRFDNGVVFYVTDTALRTVEDGADVLRGAWTACGIQNGSSLHLENLAIVLDNNQHPVRCVDLRRVDRVEVKNLSLLAYGGAIAPDSDVGLATPPPIPAAGCIGLTMTDGSNYNYSNYTNLQTWGFDEGIQVGGEHVVCINCGATIGRYGFTFGNYPVNNGTNHPITLINCMDERNIHLPYFGRWCGDTALTGEKLTGNQEISLIGFNIERVARRTPGEKLGDLMREEIPGSWCGKIEFTAQSDWNDINRVDFKLWENDGSGAKIKTVNQCHKTVCSTEERLSYAPFLGQQIFDTTLGKMVVCIDPDQKRWVDFFGNAV